MDSQETTEYTKWITKAGLLLALTLVIQMLGFPQFVTGPLVNMMLILSAFFVGGLGGSLIGGLTPWIAFTRGILPPPLAPLIPFIIVGNIILVLSFYFLQNKNRYLAIITGAILKYAILAVGVRFLVDVPPKIAKMMQIPQLLTAVTGGLLALFIIKFIRRADIS